MRLYCEVDVPFDKRSSRSISPHTLLQHKKKTLYWIWVRTRASIPVSLDFFFITFDGEPGLRYRYLSTFLSHLVENPGMNPGTSRLFVFTSGGEPGHRSLYLSTFFLSHPVPLVFLVTNMWSCRWTYKQQSQLLLNVTSFYRGNGIIAC